MPEIDGQFGYRLYRYRNETSADTITLALERDWKDIWYLHEIATLRGIDVHVVCEWMLPEKNGFISAELLGGCDNE